MSKLPDDVILQVMGLKKYYPIEKGFMRRVTGYVKALDDVSFKISSGETLGLVGESGCGKTTAALSILRAIEPTAGTILFRSHQGVVDLAELSRYEMKEIRRDIQMVFQDPYSSLNPRMPVLDIVAEPLLAFDYTRKECEEKVAELLKLVGLDSIYMRRYPHAFSGGQRQRIGIARALALNPSLVVLDEPVSALDVSVQAQILNLLKDLQEQLGLTYLFISHDLSVIRHICDRVAVMYLGRLVELADVDDLFLRPLHPYTSALLSAVPDADPEQPWSSEVIMGEIAEPSHQEANGQCSFAHRCNHAIDVCFEAYPEVDYVDGREVACHRAKELELTGVAGL
jgi:peptide/nickel transport system ATP-binding protein